jgi:hypothetical protein
MKLDGAYLTVPKVASSNMCLRCCPFKRIEQRRAVSRCRDMYETPIQATHVPWARWKLTPRMYVGPFSSLGYGVGNLDSQQRSESWVQFRRSMGEIRPARFTPSFSSFRIQSTQSDPPACVPPFVQASLPPGDATPCMPCSGAETLWYRKVPELGCFP